MRLRLQADRCLRCSKDVDSCECLDGGVWPDLEFAGEQKREDDHPTHNTTVPEGAVINAHVCVDQWIDEDGSLKFSVGVTGDVPLTQHLGPLELAKAAVLNIATDD